MATLLLLRPSLVIGACWALYVALHIAANPKRDACREKLLALVVLCTVAAGITVPAAGLLDRITPLKDDLYIYRIDGLLGFQPSFAVARFFDRSQILHDFIVFCYTVMLTPITIVLAVRLSKRYSRAEFLLAVKAFLVNCYLAVAIYLLVPVCGPIYAFPSFPHNAPVHADLHRILIHAAPNGVPSVHVSVALLIVYFSWRSRWARWAAIAFAVLTAVAVLATGEHYLFDLVVAIPYTAAVLWICGAFAVDSWKQEPAAAAEEAVIGTEEFLS